MDDDEKQIKELELSKNDLKTTGKSLITEEEKMRFFFEESPIAYQSLDEEGKLIEINQTWLNILGYCRGEVVGRSFECFLKNGQNYSFQENFEKFKQQGNICGVEYEMVKKDGGSVFVQFKGQVVKDENGGFVQASCLFQNVTENKEVEKAYLQSEETARALLNASTDSAFLVDLEGVFVEMNEVTAERLGRKVQDLIGRKAADFISPGLGVSRMKVLENVLREKKYIRFTDKRDGLMLDNNVYPIFDQAGNIYRVAIFSKDITIQHREETNTKRLNKLNEKLLVMGPLIDKLKLITECVVETFEADFARIWVMKQCDKAEEPCVHNMESNGNTMCGNQDTCLHLLSSSGRYTGINGQRRRIPYGGHKIGEIITGDQPKYVTNDIYNDHDDIDVKWAKGNNLKSFAGCRLLSEQGKPIGVLAFFSTKEIDVASEYMLENIANTTSHVIQSSLKQEELQESLLRLDEAVKASNVGLWDWNMKRDEVSYSLTWKNQIGYEEHEITNNFTEWEKRVHPDDIEEVVGSFRNCIEQNLNGFDAEFRFKHKSGEYRWILAKATLIRDGNGKPERFIGSHVDITVRKEMESALRDSEEKFRLITTEMSEGVTLVDYLGRHIYVNPAFCKMSGYSEKELLELTVYDMKVDLDTPSASLKAIGSKEYMRSDYVELKRKNGSVYFSRITSQRITLGNRKLILAVIDDITELKNREDQLIEANATKDKFFSILAHDLKGPIGSISETASILSDNVKDYNREDLERYIKVSSGTFSNVYNLLEDLLTWSRAQRNQVEHDAEPLGIAEYIEESISPVRQMAVKKSISIDIDIEKPFVLRADKKTSNMILMNLVSNAIKFTPRNGEISISCRCVFKDTEPLAQILVRDTGVGIRPKKIPKLFKIGGDVSTPGTENEKGTGLGLVLCKEFVEKNGGKIWVESEEGKGATFYYTLPLVPE